MIDMLSPDEKNSAMKLAITQCVSAGSIDYERYLENKNLLPVEIYFLQEEFRWQCAGMIMRRELYRIMKNSVSS